MTIENDPTGWIETFDFSKEPIPEGWEFLHANIVPGVGIESVSINEDEMSKHPELVEHKNHLIARFWNRNIYTITITGKK